MTYRPAQLPGSVLSIPGPSRPASNWLAANADRERAVDVLRAGFAEGRLTQDEFNERVARVYASRTYGELADLTDDLPAGPLPAGMVPPGLMPTAFRPAAFSGPSVTRPASALVSPASIAGLALTAIIVFALAALLTGAAFYVHMHAVVHTIHVPYSRPYDGGGGVHLLPSITRMH
ncbi:MAG TPA: DUF1707 domain-containing protein [Streptosporangiaceae bacterium]